MALPRSAALLSDAHAEEQVRRYHQLAVFISVMKHSIRGGGDQLWNTVICNVIVCKTIRCNTILSVTFTSV